MKNFYRRAVKIPFKARDVQAAIDYLVYRLEKFYNIKGGQIFHAFGNVSIGFSRGVEVSIMIHENKITFDVRPSMYHLEFNHIDIY